MIPYVTMEEIRKALKASSTDTGDDDSLHRYALSASRIIDAECIRQFYPQIATRLYDIPKGHKLSLDRDLLSLTTLTNGDDVAIASTDYILIPYNDTPKYAVELEPLSSVNWQTSTDGRYDRGVIDVIGVWGWHS